MEKRLAMAMETPFTANEAVAAAIPSAVGAIAHVTDVVVTYVHVTVEVNEVLPAPPTLV